jgi:hypothetical protein
MKQSVMCESSETVLAPAGLPSSVQGSECYPTCPTCKQRVRAILNGTEWRLEAHLRWIGGTLPILPFDIPERVRADVRAACLADPLMPIGAELDRILDIVIMALRKLRRPQGGRVSWRDNPSEEGFFAEALRRMDGPEQMSDHQLAFLLKDAADSHECSCSLVPEALRRWMPTRTRLDRALCELSEYAPRTAGMFFDLIAELYPGKTFGWEAEVIISERALKAIHRDSLLSHRDALRYLCVLCDGRGGWMRQTGVDEYGDAVGEKEECSSCGGAGHCRPEFRVTRLGTIDVREFEFTYIGSAFNLDGES